MIKLKIEELQKIIADAYIENETNFLREIGNIIHDNEYPINERTNVIIKGFFNWNECRPFIQFQINLDEYRYDTVFYRYDFDRRTNNETMDETEVDGEVLEVLVLYQENLK